MTVPAFVRTLPDCRAVHAVRVCHQHREFPWGGSFLPDSLVPVRERVSFAKIDEVLPLPDLVGIQRVSFDWLLNEAKQLRAILVASVRTARTNHHKSVNR